MEAKATGYFKQKPDEVFTHEEYLSRIEFFLEMYAIIIDKYEGAFKMQNGVKPGSDKIAGLVQHDMADHNLAGKIIDRYDEVPDFDILPRLNIHRATEAFLKLLNDSKTNQQIIIETKVGGSVRYMLKLFKKDRMDQRDKSLLPYLDIMTDQELIDIVTKFEDIQSQYHWQQSRNEQKGLIMKKLLDLVPRVKRESVFQYYLLKNNYKWVELCLDALIAGATEFPPIPEYVLRENTRLNGLYKNTPLTLM